MSALLFLDRPIFRRAFHLGALALRGVTLGVRGAAIDPDGRICLVRHTYMAGWYLPGGGVELGETAEEAMRREFREEAEIVPTGPLHLHGFYRNVGDSRRDHVAFYVARTFTVTGPKGRDREIAECGFFPLDALPEGTTRATQDRLRELREGGPAAATW